MKLAGIRLLNFAAKTLLVTGLIMIPAAVAGGVVLGAETVFAIFYAVGWIAVGACLLLTFAVDRVRCPNCGKPFNRPDYRDAPFLCPL
jgi:hypothetical protein